MDFFIFFTFNFSINNDLSFFIFVQLQPTLDSCSRQTMWWVKKYPKRFKCHNVKRATITYVKPVIKISRYWALKGFSCGVMYVKNGTWISTESQRPVLIWQGCKNAEKYERPTLLVKKTPKKQQQNNWKQGRNHTDLTLKIDTESQWAIQ